MEIRGYADIRTKLNASIGYYDALIKMWKNVEFITKKDGTPFKVFSKNFKNASIGKYYPVEDWGNPYLTVDGEYYINENGYRNIAEDHMQIYVDKYNSRLPEHNEEREMRSWCGIPREVMTIEEIKSEVAYRISELERYKKEAEDALEMSEAVFKLVEDKLKEIHDIVYDGDIKSSSLEYALQDYVRGFRRYMG